MILYNKKMSCLEIEVINTEPIDINLASETIGITTTQEVLVDTGLTEIGISQWPATNMNIDIVAQTLPSLNIQSANKDIASEDTLQEINNSVSPYLGINPLEEKLYSKANLIYESNYRTEQETEDQYWYEVDFLSAGTSVAYTDYGLNINITAFIGAYTRRLRFYPPIDGNTLFVYTLNSPPLDTTSVQNFNHTFGLEGLNGASIEILVGTGEQITETLRIQISGFLNDGSLASIPTISNSSFNIDTVDGNGPSGYDFFARQSGTDGWATNKFFIFTDNHLHYTFGLINGINLIPMHSFQITSSPTRFTAMKPVYSVLRFDSSTENPTHDWLGFSIYSNITDITKCFKAIFSISEEKTFTVSTDEPLIALRYIQLDKYLGNIQLLKFYITTEKTSYISIYYSVDNEISLTGSTFSGSAGGVIVYDTDATAWTGGKKIYSQRITNGEPNEIDLMKIISYQMFGYGLTDGGITQYIDLNMILITIDRLDDGVGNNNVSYDLSFAQF